MIGMTPPDLSQPQTAFPSYYQPEVPPRLAARLHNVFGQNLALPQLVFKSRQAVLDTVQVRWDVKATPVRLFRRPCRS